MKKMYTKIPAMIAMLITLGSFVLLIVALCMSKNEVEPERGVSKSFALAVLALITALLGLVFYYVDAVLSIVKACKRIDPVFNGILALVILGTLPAILLSTRVLPDVFIAVWVTLPFVLEMISVIRQIKLESSGRRPSEEDTP